MKFKEILNEANFKNKTKIKLLQNLTPGMFKISLLRNSKFSGDIEVVNNTVLGTLKRLGIKFEKIVEEDCGSDSAPAESTFTDADNAKGPGDRIGSKKKQKTKMFRKEKINWNE